MGGNRGLVLRQRRIMTQRTLTSNATPVYLCQISAGVSCGACCGLYNVADPDPDHLEAMLVRRTDRFCNVPRSVAGIDAFQAWVNLTEPQLRPWPDFHHCPFLGMIGKTDQRVGCLLHPLANGNNGLDWRGLSHYGGMACRVYFCPSVRKLPQRWLSTVRQGMDHWYLHGLFVTERGLLTAFFEAIEARIGRPLTPADVSESSGTAPLLRKFAALKLNWPYRRRDSRGVCNYFFEDGRHRRLPAKRTTAGIPDSPFERVFQELDSAFSSTAELRDAETVVGAIFGEIERRLANQG